MNTANSDEQVFDTVDVVALYLGKTFSLKQMPKIKAVVEFLVGEGGTFSYDDIDRHLKIQQCLSKKFSWLKDVRYNRKDIEKMIQNIIHNHGETIKLTSAKI